MKNEKRLATPHSLVVCAMTAALYTALCTLTAPLSYGPVQIRIAEIFTLLPVFSPIFIWGVTLGCLLSNLVGFMTGANILGYLDIFFGTTATLAAAMLTYQLRNVRVKNVPVLAAVPPVLVNALVIGLELNWLISGQFVAGIFLLNALYVGLGQLAACFALGLPMVRFLEKNGVAHRYLGAPLQSNIFIN